MPHTNYPAPNDTVVALTDVETIQTSWKGDVEDRFSKATQHAEAITKALAKLEESRDQLKPDVFQYKHDEILVKGSDAAQLKILEGEIDALHKQAQAQRAFYDRDAVLRRLRTPGVSASEDASIKASYRAEFKDMSAGELEREAVDAVAAGNIVRYVVARQVAKDRGNDVAWPTRLRISELASSVNVPESDKGLAAIAEIRYRALHAKLLVQAAMLGRVDSDLLIQIGLEKQANAADSERVAERAAIAKSLMEHVARQRRQQLVSQPART